MHPQQGSPVPGVFPRHLLSMTARRPPPFAPSQRFDSGAAAGAPGRQRTRSGAGAAAAAAGVRVILVDTSVWIDHLRAGESSLAELLDGGGVLAHPFIIGELALGRLRRRALILGALSDLPQVRVASDAEVRHFIERHALHGLGIGYVDAHLLAAVRLTAGAALWTRDKRLNGIARRLGMATRLPLR